MNSKTLKYGGAEGIEYQLPSDIVCHSVRPRFNADMALASDISDLGEDGYVESDGVKIHFVTKGVGPLVT